MPPRNKDNNPDNNPYGKGGYGFRNVAERGGQLDKEFDALKAKETSELGEILEKQAEVFEQEKELLEKMVDEVEDRGQRDRIPKSMPLDFELEEPAQNDSKGLAETICNNNERIDKMVRVRHGLKQLFSFLENVTLTGDAPDDGGEPLAGRPDRNRERGVRPEERANRAIEAVANWYEEETKRIIAGEAPVNAPQFIQEQEENEEYKRLADPRKVGKMVLSRQKWDRARTNYQRTHVEGADKKRAKKEFDKAVAWLKEEIERVKHDKDDRDEPDWLREFLAPDNLAHLERVEKVDAEEARADLEAVQAERDERLEKKNKEKDIAEAKHKLELAHEWLSKLEEKVNDANSDLADLKAEFNKIGAHPNAVFQAREFIREKNLSTDDKVKPENNRMEKRLEEIEKKIKEREKEKLASEVKEVLNKLNAFLAEIQKQPGEFGPRYDTVEKRTREWGELLAEINPILARANASPAIARELRADLLPIEELRNRTIPEALAAAALRTARDRVLKAEEILNSLKTYDDLINKIKEHKTSVEGREVPVPPNELINDTDVDDWLEEFNRRALEETNNAREFLDQHGFANNPNFIPNIENLNKEIARYEDLLEKKMAALREAKHRSRVKEAVTSKAVQKGAAKRAAMFPEQPEAEAKRIDIDEIKKNEVWGQIINVLLREHGFFGRERGGSEARVAQSEASIIQRLQHEFGPASPFHFSNEQCEDLFYAAKSWVFERLSLSAMGERRQAMPEAAEQGGVEAKPAPDEQAKKSGRWKSIVLRALGWTGLGLGAAAAAPALGFSALAGFGAVGALRVIDNIRHHVEEHRKFNREKQRLQGDDKFRNALVEHLSFTVANLRENTLRGAGAAGLGYQEYFQNIRAHLAHENDEREKPLSQAELDKTAAAFAVFYETDDRIERERRGREVNRSANARHWWEYIDLALGQAVRGGRLGKGIQISNPSRRLFSGSAWMGASFGLMACRDVMPGLKHILRAYAGWKIGGAAVDWWAGKRSPENVAEEKLAQLEAMVPKLAEMDTAALGVPIQLLSDCRAILNAISNPVEYARQKERLKEVLMATLAEKILKEEQAHELTEQAEIASMGSGVAGEIAHYYVEGREQQAEQEGRVNRYRIYGRVLGAAGMMVGGLWLENFLHDLLLKPIPHSKGGVHTPEPVGAGARGGEEPTPAPRRGPEGMEGLPPVEHPPVGPMPVWEDAVVHKGEGVEHALRRQIEADPEKWGYTGKGSVHRFAGHEAHRIASELEYVKGSAEVRVRPWDKIAYILEQDATGRPSITEVLVHKQLDGSFVQDVTSAPHGAGTMDQYEYGYHKPAVTAPVTEDHPVHKWSVSKAPAEYKLVDGKSFHLMQGQVDGENQTLVFDADGHRFGFVDEHGVVQHKIPAGGWPIGSPEQIDLHAGVAAAAAEASAGESSVAPSGESVVQSAIATSESIAAGRDTEGAATLADHSAETGSDARSEEALYDETLVGAGKPVEITLGDGSSIEIFKAPTGKVTVNVDPSDALLKKYQNNLSAEPWFRSDIDLRGSVPARRLNLFENSAPGRLAKMELYVDALQNKKVLSDSGLQKAVKDILAMNIRNFTTFSGYEKPDELFTDEVLKQAGLK